MWLIRFLYVLPSLTIVAVLIIFKIIFCAVPAFILVEPVRTSGPVIQGTTTSANSEEAGFAQIHVFKYSRRQGTMADAMPGQIEESVKVKRSEKLIAIEKELEQKYQSAFLEKEEEVLLEEVVEENGKKYLAGYNERYVRIGIPVEEENTDTAQRCNTIATVRILGHASDSMLLGEYR